MDKINNYTKAPWLYIGGDNGSVEIEIGDVCATLCRWEKNTGVFVQSRDEMEANAQLIALAPTLYEQHFKMLERVEEFKRQVSNWINAEMKQGAETILTAIEQTIKECEL